MTDFRTKPDGTVFPISNEESEIDEAIRRTMEEGQKNRPRDVCGVCGKVVPVSELIENPNSYADEKYCMSCIAKELGELERMESSTTPSPRPAQRQQSPNQQSSGDRCSKCGFVFPTGPGSSGSHRRHYEQFHREMLV